MSCSLYVTCKTLPHHDAAHPDGQKYVDFQLSFRSGILKPGDGLFLVSQQLQRIAASQQMSLARRQHHAETLPDEFSILFNDDAQRNGDLSSPTDWFAPSPFLSLL